MSKQTLTKEDREAEHRDCIRCARPDQTRNCHYNGFRAYRFGKGFGIKGTRLAMAEFCQHCDDLFSEKSYGDWLGGSESVERSEEFLFWCVMTQIRRAELAA